MTHAPTPACLYTYRLTLERVIDGDTYQVIIDLGFYVFTRQRVRLATVDCPPIGTIPGQRATKAAAAWFSQATPPLLISTTRRGRYGRIIADITAPNAPAPDLATYMLSHGCKPWTGRR